MSFEYMWRNANPDEVGGGAPPPDGEYQVQVKETKAWGTTDGREFIRLVLRTADMTFEWSVLLGFASQVQANIAARQMKGLGLDHKAYQTFQAVGDAISTLTGQWFVAEVQRRGDYVNSWFRGPVAATTPPPTAPPAPAAPPAARVVTAPPQAAAAPAPPPPAPPPVDDIPF